MRTEPVSKLFLKKASELLAGLLSMFGFYTAMIVSVYNITFNQESFGRGVTCPDFQKKGPFLVTVQLGIEPARRKYESKSFSKDFSEIKSK